MTGLRESWDADPQVALVAGGCEADHLTWEGNFAAAVAIAERAQTYLDTVAGEGMYGGLWLSALGLAALADEASYCRQRRDEAGRAALGGEKSAGTGRTDRRGRDGRPGDLGPEGRAWHARAWPSTPGCRASRPSSSGSRRWTASATGTSTSRPAATGGWPRRWSRWVTGGGADPRESAAAAAEQMRAVPLQRAVAATVSRARLSGPTTAADAVLTGREQEVLALVAEGLTNREIGSACSSARRRPACT